MKPSALMAMLVIAALGAGAVLFGSAAGIGLNHDGVVYLDGARDLRLHGSYRMFNWLDGTRTPIIGYPPLFPALVAGLMVVVADPGPAARLLNVVCFAITILLVASAVHRESTTAPVRLALLAAVLVATAPDLLTIHAMALSEPIFLCLLLAALILLAGAIRRDSLARLGAAAVCFGLAGLARHAGSAFVLAGATGVLLLPAWPRRRRLAALALLLSLAALPAAGWALRNLLLTGHGTNRVLNWHPVSAGHLRMGFGVVTKWFLPVEIPPLPRALIVAGLLGLLAYLATRRRPAAPPVRPRFAARRGDPLPALLLLAAAIYPLFLLVSISWVDAHTPLDHRLLSPVFLCLVPAGCLAIDRVLPRLPARHSRVLLLLLALLAAWSSARAAAWAHAAHRDGIGYAARIWTESPLIRWIRQTPGKVWYSNGQDVIYALTGQPALTVPYRFDPGAPRPSGNYQPALDQVGAALRSGTARLVYFRKLTWRPYLVSEAELRDRLPLTAIAEFPDGIVYGIPPSETAPISPP